MSEPDGLPRRSDGSIDLAAMLDAVHAAAERLAPYVRRTPCVYSYTYSEGAGVDVHLKLENLQRTGSFKLRGALHKHLALEPAQRERGVIAASAGNHAQGVALAAKLLGSRATIVMPKSAPLTKVRRTEGYGAEVLLHGESYDEAQARARELAAERGLVLFHPFDDLDVVLGQATVALEILDQIPDVATIVVPVGGGGLLAGMSLVARALAPRVRLIGVQAEGAAPMAASIRSGRRETVASPRTMADGIRIGTTGELTFAILRELVDDVVTVDEESISRSVVDAIQMSKVVAEPAAVAGLAAIASGRVAGGAPICAVISGGNIDLNFLGRLIESGLAHQGFYHPVVLRLRDAPGELRRVLEVLAATESNVIEVQHHRSGWRVPVGSVDVEILIETRHAGEGAHIDASLRASGFEVAD